jgi:hypothetical protein
MPGYPAFSPFAPRRSSVGRKTNRFATAALVLGVLPGAVVAVVCGLLALRGIRRRGEHGLGRALAGIVLGVAWTVVLLLANRGSERAVAGGVADQTTGLGSRNAKSLRVGECTAVPPPVGTVVRMRVIACAGPHRAEVYADLDLPPGPWPGDRAVLDRAERYCDGRLDAIVKAMSPPGPARVKFLAPNQSAWFTGTRRVTCLLEFVADQSGRLLPAR